MIGAVCVFLTRKVKRFPERGSLCHLHGVITFNTSFDFNTTNTGTQENIPTEQLDLFLILQYITQTQTHQCHRDDESTSAS